jgi:ParE toxin of type II toxin-antitoxin system, parDE
VGTSVRERSLPELREIVVGNYRVIYRLGKQLVDIIAIVHAARQLRDVDWEHHLLQGTTESCRRSKNLACVGPSELLLRGGRIKR